MGEVIRKDAAAADILADANTTLTRAVARGGGWQSAAEGRLGPVITLAASVDARRKSATEEYAPVSARLDAQNDVADKLVGRISDDIWNLLGRPGNDPALEILFPGGVSYYTDGDVTEQPARMQLLAELLESGIHPRLEPARANAFAAELRTSAATLQPMWMRACRFAFVCSSPRRCTSRRPARPTPLWSTSSARGSRMDRARLRSTP